jgi:HPt (histidine-containing phosphotransfer) domain-containing protein
MNSEEQKIFDLEHGMMIFGNDKEMLGLIIKDFIQNVPADLDALEAAVGNMLVEETERYAHRLVGAAGMIGAMKLMDLARQMETDAKEGRLKRADLMIRTLKDEFVSFKCEIETQGFEKP